MSVDITPNINGSTSKGDRTMSQITSEQTTPITNRELRADSAYASRNFNIIDSVFDFIDEHGTDVSVHFLFEKYTDG